MNTIVGVIAVLVLVGGSAALLNVIRDKHQHSRKAKQEKDVFRLAQQAGGRLTVADVVTATSLSADEADRLLEEMVKKGHAGIQVTDSGGIVYEWLSMLPAAAPAETDTPGDGPQDAIVETPEQTAPQKKAESGPVRGSTPDISPDNPTDRLNVGLDGIVSRFPKTLASSGILSERLKIISTAYKNWLPKLVDRLDELAAKSDEAALHAFKPILTEELAKYRDYQQKSQFSEGEETDTQFQARMILKFSSGPMIQVLESALREVRYWESHPDTVDAATVVQKIRMRLQEDLSA